MGQTLSHGVYLPNEGERNCYAGLASNWQILNTAVGNIAEKAPLVHTHGNITNDGKVGTTANLPLITGTGGAVQAGSFGNAANTFCEGNDSRLSDARTPVAHTHGKADITDLFNSANVWLGSQTYGAYLKSFGEARTDEWSGNSRTNAYLLSRHDTDDVSGFLISTFRSNQAQGTAGHIYGWDILENSTRYSGLRFTIDWDSTLNSGNGAYRVTLGTNTQGTNPCNDLHITQLKTINGINPGALSLPDMDSTVSKSTELATAIDKTQTANSWTADFTGILRITWFVKNLTGPFRCIVSNNSDIRYATWGQTFSANNVWYFIVSFPVQNGKTYYFENSFTRTSEDTAPIIYGASAVYCLGNV